jgi:hypothetical protein
VAAGILPAVPRKLSGLAQVALKLGADDLHGTIIEEYLFHGAGATSPQLQTEMDMGKVTRKAGRTPGQRNTFYEPIKVLADTAPSANEAEPAAGISKVLEDNLVTERIKTDAMHLAERGQPVAVGTHTREALDEIELAEVQKCGKPGNLGVREAHLARPAAAGGATLAFVKDRHAPTPPGAQERRKFFRPHPRLRYCRAP